MTKRMSFKNNMLTVVYDGSYKVNIFTEESPIAYKTQCFMYDFINHKWNSMPDVELKLPELTELLKTLDFIFKYEEKEDE